MKKLATWQRRTGMFGFACTEPLPELFVKKAVAALFAQVCLKTAARSCRLQKANICVHMQDILLDTPFLSQERDVQCTECVKSLSEDINPEFCLSLGFAAPDVFHQWKPGQFAGSSSDS